jgi:hypothetical protein
MNVVVEDVLDCANIGSHEAVILWTWIKDQRQAREVQRASYTEKGLKVVDVTKAGHPFLFRVASVDVCHNLTKMTVQPMRLVRAWDDPERREQGSDVRPKEVKRDPAHYGESSAECNLLR